MKQPKSPLPISVIIVFGFLAMAIVSIGYCLWDLQFPNHFVNEFYGMEVIARLPWLVIPTVLLIVGSILFVSALAKDKKEARRAGAVLVIVASIVLLPMALNVSRSRKQWEIREDYPNRTVEELLHIARHDDAKEAQFAIDALQTKKDPAAVPGLCEILLNETERGHLRSSAADALGEIGGEQAREALEKVQASNPNRYLMNAVKYALYTRMGLPKVPENSKADEPRTEPIDSPPESKP